MSDWQAFWEGLKPYFILFLVGGMGGTLRQARNNSCLRFLLLAKTIVLSGFMGLLAGFFAKGQGWNPDLQYAVAGTMGLFGQEGISLLCAILLKRFFNVDVSQSFKDADCLDERIFNKDKELVAVNKNTTKST